MIKGRKVYDPLTDTWSTGYWVADDKGNYYPVWQKGAVMEDGNFFEKCRTCQHCYTKNDDDYVYCRKRNGKCEYKPYKSRKELRGEENESSN